MKNPLLCYIIFIIFIITSCSDTLDYVERIEALPIDNTLQGNIISFNGKIEIFNPQNIVNIDNDYLMIMDQREDGIFHVFELPQVGYLYSWGRRGEGPDEFPSLSFLSLNVKGNQIILYAPGTHTLLLYTVTDTALVFDEKQRIFFNYQHQPLNRLQRLSDSLYVAIPHWTENTDKEFIALKPNEGKLLFAFGEYPDLSLNRQERMQEYAKITTVKPDGSKFIAFYGGYNMFKIFNNNGSLIKQVKINDKSLPTTTSNNKFIFRIRAHASDNYIYTLSLNTTEEDISQDPESFRPLLEVWDWDGNQISRFRFDRLVTDFTVSEKYRKLYALSVYDIHQIFEYDLELNL